MWKFIGSWLFYKKMFWVMIPIFVQNLITNFLNLLDNLMVGRIGTEPMSGVAIVNQLLFVFTLCVLGGVAGAGIFAAQYHGKGDNEGVRNTFRAKLWFSLAAAVLFGVLFRFFGRNLISLFITGGGEKLDLAATLAYGEKYLRIMLWQMPLFAVINVYGSTLRETGETRLPMHASITAVLVNLCGNYILIYGKFGAPALGVVGAALATVLARIVECVMLISGAHRRCVRDNFAAGLYRTLRIPGALFKLIAATGYPLIINELVWALGTTTMMQIVSRHGLEVVPAEKISSTVSSLFFCVMFAMGSSISIIDGQLLGAGETERAVDEDRKLIAASVILCAVAGGAMALIAPLIPNLYNTTPRVRELATDMLRITAVMLPFIGFTNASDATLRSGGKTWIAFLFDGVFVWAASIPFTWFLVEKTSLGIIPVFALSYAGDLVRCVIGFVLIKKRTWVKNLVKE